MLISMPGTSLKILICDKVKYKKYPEQPAAATDLEGSQEDNSVENS